MKRLLPAFWAIAIGAVGGLAASLLLLQGPLAEPPAPAPVATPTTAASTTIVSTTSTSVTTLVAPPVTRPSASISLPERSRLLEMASDVVEANHSDWNEGPCAAWPVHVDDIDFCSYKIWAAMNRTADVIDVIEAHLVRFPDDETVRERLSALQRQSNLHQTLRDQLRARAPSINPG